MQEDLGSLDNTRFTDSRVTLYLTENDEKIA